MSMNIRSGISDGAVQYNTVDALTFTSGSIAVPGNMVVNGSLSVPTASITTASGVVASTAFVQSLITTRNVPIIVTATGTGNLDSGTLTYNHTGPVLIQFSGFAFTAGQANLGWTFFVNGQIQDSFNSGVNYEVICNPSYYWTFNPGGNFTVRTTITAENNSSYQMVIWYY